MTLKRHARLLTYLLVALSVFSSCKQRYGYIPRSFSTSQTAQSGQHYSGHYVQSEKTKAIQTRTFNPNEAQPLTRLYSGQSSKLTAPRHTAHRFVKPRKFIQEKTFNTPIDSTRDSTNRSSVDPTLSKGSEIIFGVAAIMNVAMLFTPFYNYMFLAILIGLGLLVIGYFLNQLVKNMRKNRVKPLKNKDAADARRRLKKVVGTLFIVSGSLFMLALVFLGLGFFDASFFFAIFGIIAFYAALLAGFIYLLLGLA